MSFSRTVHPQSDVKWMKADEIIGDMLTPDSSVNPVHIAMADASGEPEVLEALVFTDMDGEQHVYLFTGEGKRNLLAALTGGVQVARTLREVMQ